MQVENCFTRLLYFAEICVILRDLKRVISPAGSREGAEAAAASSCFPKGECGPDTHSGIWS
jgi:hypothetical protein